MLFTKSQEKTVRNLNTPEKIKKFIEEMKYNEGDWLTVPQVLEKRKAACLEAAVLAVLILRYHKYEAYLLDLEAVRDEDHVLAVYKIAGKWGSIAKSKFINLRHRQCEYENIRELAMSYLEHYFNFYGEISLRKYSEPLRIEGLLKKFDANTYEFMDETAGALIEAKHHFVTKKKKMPHVTYEKFWSEISVLPKNVKIGKRYKR